MSHWSARLTELGIELPQVVAPLAAYVPAVRTGNLVYTAGQLPIHNGNLLATGKVGADVPQEDAKALARQCALNALAAIDALVGIDAVVLSTQHNPDVKQSDLREAVMELIIKHSLPAELLHKDTQYHINPTGQFVIGGPVGDCGLTGRKIIVDTYGGMARHGGGAFSGKDPSKVDRSAAYAMRWVAKNVVAAGLAGRCEVQVAYAIGAAQPVGLYIETFGTEQVPVDKIQAAVSSVFDLRPLAIVEELDLLRPIYAPTAAYGHFGRTEAVGYDNPFPWEQTTKVEALQAAVR